MRKVQCLSLAAVFGLVATIGGDSILYATDTICGAKAHDPYCSDFGVKASSCHWGNSDDCKSSTNIPGGCGADAVKLPVGSPACATHNPNNGKTCNNMIVPVVPKIYFILGLAMKTPIL